MNSNDHHTIGCNEDTVHALGVIGVAVIIGMLVYFYWQYKLLELRLKHEQPPAAVAAAPAK